MFTLARAARLVLALCCCAMLADTVAAQGTSGACCLPNGTCVTADKCSCDIQGGVHQGVGSTCVPGACATITFGACCTNTGCALTGAAGCAAASGLFAANQTCVAMTCVGPTTGCCCPSACIFTNDRYCVAVGGTLVISCTPNPCPQQVCCDPMTGACTFTVPCAGTIVTSTTACSPNPCPPPPFVVCCDPTGGCNLIPLGTPCSGTIFPGGTSCNPNPCRGVCCIPCTGACVAMVTISQCPGAGMFYPGQLTCTNTAGQPFCPMQPLFGHCCLNGNCSSATSCDCIIKGGTFYGNQPCNPAQCQQDQLGACCNVNNGVCSQLSAGTCAAMGPSWIHLPGQPCTPGPACQASGPGQACCCCNTCKVLPAPACVLAGGVVQPVGTACQPTNPCLPPVTGACCTQNAAGGVVCNAPVTQNNCNGIFYANTTCTPNNPCIIICCDAVTGACTPLFGANACPTGQNQVTGTTCTPNPCPPAQVCCDPATGMCQTLIAAVGCPPGWLVLSGVTCQPNNPCPGVYVCCIQTAAGVTCQTIPLGTPCMGTPFPSLSSCTPNPCIVGGACCGPNGCVISANACDCYTQIGGPFFPNQPCTPALCPTTGQVQGACCVPNSAGTVTCVQTTSANCAQLMGNFTNGGTCPLPGGCSALPKVACCCPNNTCSFIDPAICNLAGGTVISGATTCYPFICNPGSGACCNPATNTCTSVANAAACPTTSIFYPGVSCVGITCPPPNGACCTPCTGVCTTVLNASQCPGLGNFIAGATCQPNNPCPATGQAIQGACCFPPGNCVQTHICECVIKQGIWFGPGGLCTPNNCNTQTTLSGACCIFTTGTCTVNQVSASTCTQAGGNFLAGGTCNQFPVLCTNAAPPCCCCGGCHDLDPAICNLAGGTIGATGTSCLTSFPCQPNSGACCNPATGLCTQVPSPNNCAQPSIFYLQQPCTAIPPCAQTGACCDCLTGACTVVPQTQCPAPNTWTAGAACLPPFQCTPTCGACCNFATGACTIVASATACPGQFFGVGVPCPPPPCIPPITICCNPSTGACVTVTGTSCPAPLFPSTAASCSPINPCPRPGACCIPGTTNCFITIQANCVDATGLPYPWFPNSVCTPNPCYAACCDPAGSGNCVQIFASTTCPNNWTFMGLGTSCSFVLCPVQIQACCNATTGACQVVIGTLCPPGWYNYGGLCFNNPCPPPGPCCIPGTTTCFITVQAQCNGWWGPANGSCTPNPCRGACCHPTNGGCIITQQVNCPAPGTYVPGGTCQPNSCPGACCNPATGLCTVVPASACPTPNLYLGNGTACSASVQCKPGVCCRTTGQCLVVPNAGACPAPNYFLPSITTCLPYPCRGACCLASGGCTLTSPQACTAPNQWFGPFTSCFFSPCPGACCTSTGGCTITPSFGCLSVIGSTSTWLSGQTCVPNPCLGACCKPPNVSAYGQITGTMCVITSAANCNGNFKGVGTTCFTGPPTNLTTCCPANVNGTGGLGVPDIFAFLTAWFNNCTGAPGAPCFGINADFNGSGGLPTVADIFAFLTAWFTGCS